MNAPPLGGKHGTSNVCVHLALSRRLDELLSGNVLLTVQSSRTVVKVTSCKFLMFQTLKMLNSNTENPYLIWNNGTRAELLEFLESQQDSMIKRVSCSLL